MFLLECSVKNGTVMHGPAGASQEVFFDEV